MCRLRGLARAVGLPLLFAISASLDLSAQSSSSTSDAMRATYVEINGKKSPERIPEYMVWRQAFRSLAEMDAQKQTAVLEGDLPLSTREKTVVMDTARRQLEADARCDARQRAVHAERLQAGVTAADALASLRPVILACRQEVLDAADALIPALGPDTQIALRQWVDRRRAAITVWVPKSDLPFFNKPR